MKRNLYNLLGFILISFSVIGICYFTSRVQFLNLLQLSLIGWIGSALLVQKLNLKKTGFIIFLGIFLKLTLLFSIPQLSDDFFRFLWDGSLVLNGYNPYLITPFEFEKINTLSAFQKTLLEGMNSNNYFAVYLPLNQQIFGIASIIAGKNITINLIVFRLFFLLVESLFIIKLWRLKRLNKWWIIFLFNPLYLTETYGNVHFELLMVCFFGLGLFYEKTSSLKGVFLGLSAAIKPHILIVFPFFLVNMAKKVNLIKFLLGLFLGFNIWFLPYLNPLGYQNMVKSIMLFINSFEFNASFFYLARWLGFEIVGYDPIKTIGPLFSALTAIFLSYMLYLSIKKPNKAFDFALYGYTFYLLFSTTVHPWYLIPLMFLGAKTKHVYPFIWGFLIMLSYQAYQSDVVYEKPLLLFLEYFPVILIATIEIFYKNKTEFIFSRNRFLNLYTNLRHNEE